MSEQRNSAEQGEVVTGRAAALANVIAAADARSNATMDDSRRGCELRRGHYELGADARHDQLRDVAAFDELATTI